MNYINDKEAIELLRKAGCTASEIERLRRLRQDYVKNEGRQTLRDYHHSAFVRWLIIVTPKLYGVIIV